jgi:hypothetical protein
LFESDSEHLEFIDSLLADNKYLCPVAEHVEGSVCCPNLTQRLSKAANKWTLSTLLPGGSYPGFINITLYDQVNNRGKYDDGFCNSTIDNNDGHIPSPLILFTCTVLRHVPLEWQKYQGVHAKASKSKLKADRLDHSNYFKYMTDGDKNASCCAAIGHKLLTLPGVADTYAFLINTWSTLQQSYQQRVYNNTLATVKRQIQQEENPTPAMVISVQAARVDNAILPDYFTSDVALEEPEIGSTDPNIPTENNCMEDQLHFRMPWGSGDYQDEGDESDVCNVISTACRRQWPMTELQRFDLGNSNVNEYEGKDRNKADADEEQEASLGDDGSTQNLDD